MKISLYTFVKDGLYFDFHVVDMLKQHLDLADEIIVNEGYSTDGTYEAVKDIDPKIRIVRNEWDRSDPKTWRKKFVDQTRQLCTGDWCIMIDADEFIPEWEFPRMRDVLATTDKTIFRFDFVHFYGNYQVYHADSTKSGWPKSCGRIHRNIPEVEVWGDASTVRHRDIRDRSIYGDEGFACHHFGAVRNPARLRQKWRIQDKRNRHKQTGKAKWDRTPGIVFDVMPHKWDDPDFMQYMTLYEGPICRAVRENPDEFVRDDFLTCRLLGHEPATA